MPTKYLTVAGVATHFFYTGPTTLPPDPPRLDRGRTLLFLHGAGGNAAVWRRQLEHVAAAHSALAIDLPAHGRSGSTEGLGSIEAQADFVDRFARALGLRDVVVVGTCMGAGIALELAASRADWAAALALVGAAAPLRFPAATVDIWQNVANGRVPQPFTPDQFSPKTDFGIMRELFMEQVKTDPRVRWTDMLACNEYDPTTRLAGIALPALVVSGADDALAPPEAAEALRARLGNARLVRLEEAGHCAAAEKSEAFNGAVGEFVAELPGGR